MVEAKASNIGSQLKVAHHQIDDYMQARAEGWKVSYAFWMYGEKQLVKRFKTYHKIIKAVVGSVQYLDILDITIVDAIRRYEIDDSWKVGITSFELLIKEALQRSIRRQSKPMIRLKSCSLREQHRIQRVCV